MQPHSNLALEREGNFGSRLSRPKLSTCKSLSSTAKSKLFESFFHCSSISSIDFFLSISVSGVVFQDYYFFFNAAFKQNLLWNKECLIASVSILILNSVNNYTKIPDIENMSPRTIILYKECVPKLRYHFKYFLYCLLT